MFDIIFITNCFINYNNFCSFILVLQILHSSLNRVKYEKRFNFVLKISKLLFLRMHEAVGSNPTEGKICFYF